MKAGSSPIEIGARKEDEIVSTEVIRPEQFLPVSLGKPKHNIKRKHLHQASQHHLFDPAQNQLHPNANLVTLDPSIEPRPKAAITESVIREVEATRKTSRVCGPGVQSQRNERVALCEIRCQLAPKESNGLSIVPIRKNTHMIDHKKPYLLWHAVGRMHRRRCQLVSPVEVNAVLLG